MVLTIIKVYFVIVVIVLLIYAVRHAIFTFNRLFARQRMYCNDIIDSNMPSLTVLIPMYNEEKVAHNVLDSLLACKYDRDKLEIIPINDGSTDHTKEILDQYSSKYPFIRPLHRNSSLRGKPAGLNDAMKIATGEIVVIFDADYRPTKDLLYTLAISFQDPSAGAVMGRVVPLNAVKNRLTRLINLERSGGYQVDQQARYNMRLIPQYGGTVGGFRRSLLIDCGGFDPKILAEDTALTFKLYTKGWKVIYANNAECYEEVPETWDVRAKQVRRWSRGHNACLFKYFFPVMFAKSMSIREKVDGAMLLLVYAVPLAFALSLLCTLTLFFLGEMDVFVGWWVLLFIGFYNSYGNFAPFYQIAAAQMIDGVHEDVRLLPLLTFNFYFYIWNISLGFFDAVADVVTRRRVKWAKTDRFAESPKFSPVRDGGVS